MEKSLRVIFFIPISILAFFSVFLIAMVVCSLFAMLANVSDNLRYFLSEQPPVSIRGSVVLLVSSAIAGFAASISYFKVGKIVLPEFSNIIYKKIALYAMVIILGLILLYYSYFWFSMNLVIVPICYLIVLVTLVAIFISTLVDADY